MPPDSATQIALDLGIEPCRPPIKYYGGKQRMAKLIVEEIYKIPHRIYAEPFAGLVRGTVFRRRIRQGIAQPKTRQNDLAVKFLFFGFGLMRGW